MAKLWLKNILQAAEKSLEKRTFSAQKNGKAKITDEIAPSLVRLNKIERICLLFRELTKAQLEAASADQSSEELPELLARLQKLLEEYSMFYTDRDMPTLRMSTVKVVWHQSARKDPTVVYNSFIQSMSAGMPD